MALLDTESLIGASEVAQSLSLPFGVLRSDKAGRIYVIPGHMQAAFFPATHCLYEWTDYWLTCPGADMVEVGSTRVAPIAPGVFRVRFENRLGLVSLRPTQGSRPIAAPFLAEVISTKFPDADAHLGFFERLLVDLFARGTRLPFEITAITARGVTEALQPPTPLFTYHFLRLHGPELRNAIGTILARPQRRLHEFIDLVPLSAAHELDPDVLLSILQSSDEWAPSRGTFLAERLGGYAPARIRQRLPDETLDTPENRFVLAALETILLAVHQVLAQPWWNDIDQTHRQPILAIRDLLRQTIANPLFADVGRMERFPAASRVLQRRPGYREMLILWQIFQRARRPLFQQLQQAIDLRDVAYLYEVWVFFALIEELAALLNEAPVLKHELSDKSGLHHNAEARFSAGTLVYNQAARSYSSIAMRPDFMWIPAEGKRVALDAKFRLTRDAITPESDDPGTARAKHDDLYTMHAYRDGLRDVRAAVCLYPGNESVFYDAARGISQITLADLLSGELSGIGALAMNPAQTTRGTAV